MIKAKESDIHARGEETFVKEVVGTICGYPTPFVSTFKCSGRQTCRDDYVLI
jgi:hypothetical protein